MHAHTFIVRVWLDFNFMISLFCRRSRTNERRRRVQIPREKRQAKEAQEKGKWLDCTSTQSNAARVVGRLHVMYHDVWHSIGSISVCRTFACQPWWWARQTDWCALEIPKCDTKCGKSKWSPVDRWAGSAPMWKFEHQSILGLQANRPRLWISESDSLSVSVGERKDLADCKSRPRHRTLGEEMLFSFYPRVDLLHIQLISAQQSLRRSTHPNDTIIMIITVIEACVCAIGRNSKWYHICVFVVCT